MEIDHNEIHIIGEGIMRPDVKVNTAFESMTNIGSVSNGRNRVQRMLKLPIITKKQGV